MGQDNRRITGLNCCGVRFRSCKVAAWPQIHEKLTNLCESRQRRRKCKKEIYKREIKKNENSLKYKIFDF
jgi:hypothetical protein